MHPERMPGNTADNVAQILDTALPSPSLRILHGNGNRQEKRRFGSHPVLGIPGLRPLQQLFHAVAMFPDGDDERYLYLGQKPEDLPGIELPIKTESRPEPEFGDLVEHGRCTQPLGSRRTGYGQRQLPVAGSHIGVT